MVSRDKLKNQVILHFLLRGMTLMLRRRLYYILQLYTKMLQYVQLLVLIPLKCCDMLHHHLPLLCDILKNIYSMKTYILLQCDYKNDVSIIIKLHRVTRLWLVALYKSLTRIVTSFLCSKCSRT